MPRKRFTAEQIVNKLREADVLISQGQTCKQLEVTDETYYRWRREYGGLKTDQAKRLKELERENTRLKSNRPTKHLLAPAHAPARTRSQPEESDHEQAREHGCVQRGIRRWRDHCGASK